MAKEKTGIQKTAANIQKKSVFAFLKSRQTITMLAIFFILLAVFLISSFISFFFHWQEDQSTLQQFFNREVIAKNLLGKVGANLSHFLYIKVLVLLLLQLPTNYYTQDMQSF